MIPTIIYFLLRRYRRSNPKKAEILATTLQKAGKFMLLLILLILISHFALPQITKLEYSIKRKGSEIGTMTFIQYYSGDKTMFKVESVVKTRLIFLITVKALEEAVYENGIMTWSYIYRKMNGTEKINKQTKLSGNYYGVTKGSLSQTLSNFPIYYNIGVPLYKRAYEYFKSVFR